MTTCISRDTRPSTVYHVGIYAYDRESSADYYATGRYVPLCGQEKVHSAGHWQFMFGDELDRKKFCTRCARDIRELTDLLPAAPSDGVSVVLVDTDPDHVYLLKQDGPRDALLGKLTLKDADAMGSALIAYAYLAPRQHEVQS